MPQRVSGNIRAAIQIDYMRLTKNLSPIPDVYSYKYPHGFWAKIATGYDCHRQTKKLWAQYFEDNGRNIQLKEDPKKGRAQNNLKRSPAVVKQVLKQAKKRIKTACGTRGKSARKIAKSKICGIMLAHNTVRRILIVDDRYPKRPQIEKRLALTAQHKRARVIACKRSLKEPLCRRRRRYYADEARIGIVETPNKKNDILWVKRSDPDDNNTYKVPPFKGGSLNLYVVIGRRGVVYYKIYDETLDLEGYYALSQAAGKVLKKLSPRPLGLNHDNVFGEEIEEERIKTCLGCRHSIYPGRPCKFLTGRRFIVRRKNAKCRCSPECNLNNGYHKKEFEFCSSCTCLFPPGIMHPARSPGLNPCDFFFFGILHYIMADMPPVTGKSDLKKKIRKAIKKLDSDYKSTFRKIWDESLERRWREVIKAGGKHIKGH